MNNFLDNYKEIIPLMSFDELERQSDSISKFFPDMSERDMNIYELLLDEMEVRLIGYIYPIMN